MPFYKENFNIANKIDRSSDTTFDRRKYFLNLSHQDKQILYLKITNAFEKLSTTWPIKQDIRAHPIVKEKMEISTNHKHINQVSSLLGHLEHNGLLSSDETFLEFGCGKGQLASFIDLATASSARFVLVDRRSFKQKVTEAFKLIEV